MQELRNLDASQLIDLLAQYTANYTKMMSEGTTEDQYANCNLTIKALQAEIEIRKKLGTIAPNSATDITMPPDYS